MPSLELPELSRFVTLEDELPPRKPSVPDGTKLSSDGSIFIISEASTMELQPGESTNTVNVESVSTAADQRKYCHHWKLYLGLMYTIGSGFFNSSSSVIVKFITGISPVQLANFRFVVVLILTIPLTFRHCRNLFGTRESRLALLLRGLFGSTALILSYFSLRFLPVAEATIIVSIYPITVAIFARICLSEHFGAIEVVTVLLTVCGLLLMMRLPEVVMSRTVSTAVHNANEWIGIGLACACTLMVSASYIVLRKLKDVPQTVVMFNLAVIGVIVTACTTAAMEGFSLPNTALEGGLTCLLGLVSVIAQFMITTALQSEQAGPVSVVRSASEILFAFIWQVFFFNEIPDVYTISGAVVITFSVVVIGIRKWVAVLPQESQIRKRFAMCKR